MTLTAAIWNKFEILINVLCVTPHLNRKTSINKFLRNFENILDTMDPYGDGPDEICPETSSIITVLSILSSILETQANTAKTISISQLFCS